MLPRPPRDRTPRETRSNLAFRTIKATRTSYGAQGARVDVGKRITPLDATVPPSRPDSLRSLWPGFSKRRTFEPGISIVLSSYLRADCHLASGAGGTIIATPVTARYSHERLFLRGGGCRWPRRSITGEELRERGEERSLACIKGVKGEDQLRVM